MSSRHAQSRRLRRQDLPRAHSLIGRGALALATMMLAAGCASVPGDAPARDAVAQWSSSADGSRKLLEGTPLALAPRATLGAGEVTVSLDPARRHQSMVGFGAAMTDASALLLVETLKTDKRESLLRELFGRDGLAISFLRVPIGASDFSSEHYSLDDMPAGERDPEMAHFSMAWPDRAQVPALQAARRINPSLELVSSPWSAPAWMKTSGSLVTGHLRPDAYQAFARYYVRYLAEMRARGLPISWLTLQNEPDFEPDSYPGMKMTPPERAAVIADHLGPLLKGEGDQAAILDWDHNWDHPEYPLAVLSDPKAAPYVAGVAWHCYGGTVDAMEQVRARHPDKDVFFTECSGGDWAPKWDETLAWMTDNLIIAATRSGSRGTALWNLALDENHGPHKGGCGDCRAVVTIDSKTGAITRNVEYYVIGHASRFVHKGAQRIDSTLPDGLPNVAFRNPDGSLVLLAHNAGKALRRVRVEASGHGFVATVPAGEVVTFVWHP